MVKDLTTVNTIMSRHIQIIPRTAEIQRWSKLTPSRPCRARVARRPWIAELVLRQVLEPIRPPITRPILPCLHIYQIHGITTCWTRPVLGTSRCCTVHRLPHTSPTRSANHFRSTLARTTVAISGLRRSHTRLHQLDIIGSLPVQQHRCLTSRRRRLCLPEVFWQLPEPVEMRPPLLTQPHRGFS
jgi:hypothetical protein